MFRDYTDPAQDPTYSEVIELDLGSVVPSLSGPKRPHDRISVSEMKTDFQQCLDNKVSLSLALLLCLSECDVMVIVSIVCLWE